MSLWQKHSSFSEFLAHKLRFSFQKLESQGLEIQTNVYIYSNFYNVLLEFKNFSFAYIIAVKTEQIIFALEGKVNAQMVLPLFNNLTVIQKLNVKKKFFQF